MKATIIRIAVKNGTQEFPGWIVPDTDSLFGIDQREEANLECGPPEPAVWKITHLPSGFLVSVGPYTDAGTSLQAIGIAQRFYTEAKARGWDLFSTIPARVTEKYKTMSKEERQAFWCAVADFKREIAPAGEAREAS